MPKVGYKFTEEQIKHLSESHKGQHSSPATEFKKGQIGSMRGKHFTEERNTALAATQSRQEWWDKQRQAVGLQPISIEEIVQEYQQGTPKRLLLKKHRMNGGAFDNRIKPVLRDWGIWRNHKEAIALAVEQGKFKRDIHMEKHPRWKGGRCVLKTGYVLVKQPNGEYIFEHHLVWERYHQRKLPKGWHIHHINGIKSDNRPENLLGLSGKKHSLIIPELHKTIRRLEIENEQIKRILENSQMAFSTNEN